MLLDYQEQCEACRRIAHKRYMKKLENKNVCSICYVLAEKELADNDNPNGEIEGYLIGKILANKLLEDI